MAMMTPPRRDLHLSSLAGRERGGWLQRAGTDASIIAIVSMGALAALWSARSDTQPDFEVYLQAARSVLHGASPYPVVESASVYSQHAFVYPFASAIGFAPFGLLPHDAARIVFLAGSFAALVAAALLASAGRSRQAALGLIVLLAAAPSLRSFQVGALNPFMLLVLAAAWRWRTRQVVCGLLLGFAAASKLVLLPVVIWPLVAGRRVAFVTGALAATLLISAGFVAGPLSAARYGRLLGVLSLREGPLSVSLPSLAHRGGVSWQLATMLGLAIALVSCVVGVALQRHYHDERFALAGTLAASILASPIVWSHYYTLVLLVALIFPLTLVRVAWVVAASWVAFPASVDIRVPVLGDPAALRAAGALVLAVVAWRGARRIRREAPPAPA